MTAPPNLRVVESQDGIAPLRAAIYTRISRDDQGDRLGVQRQEQDCREYVKSRGWKLAKVYEDNDLSAYNGKARPAYRQLIEDLKTGTINSVIAWHPDRLHRSPRELEEFIEVVERANCRVETVRAGLLDFSTPTGKLVARQLGSIARYESEHKAERIRRKHKELAEAGKDVGAGRPFGYEEDRKTVRAEEADLIRDAVKRVITGEPVRSICRDWTSRGIPTVTGAKWTPTVVRRMLASARISGRREYRRKPTAADRLAQKPARTLELGEITSDHAEWGAIITHEESDRIRAMLSDPGRRMNAHLGRYLLTGGLARCGLCGRALVARPKADGRRCLVCATGPGFHGCGKIRTLAEPVEDLVTEAVMQAIDKGALAAVLARRDDANVADELRSVEAKLAELTAMYASDGLTRVEWDAARKSLLPRQESLRRQLETQRRATGLDDVPDAPRAAWSGLSIHRRRAIVAALVEQVVIQPAIRGRNFFDPSRVRIVWKP